MNDYLNEWKNVTFAAMSGQIPTIMEAFEGAVDRAEIRARNVVDFREAADWYHLDNPQYVTDKLCRVIAYLRKEGNEAGYRYQYGIPGKLDFEALHEMSALIQAREMVQCIVDRRTGLIREDYKFEWERGQ